ncbi:hypothetical protein A3J33_03945 [candidate division WWE3 bacterium RIFCSPLOWO2_02_FULL_53_10]|nr:MAG: hypothetical protein A3J33_03945 [candidate division WWE3 bacterium RIFCSPLOWO2_02_FULL_53_10]
MDFGAFVEILPGKEGMVHVSELAYSFVAKPTDVVQIGDKIKVKVIEIDAMGRINLSKKALEKPPEGYQERPREDRGGPSGPPRPGGRPFRPGGFGGGSSYRGGPSSRRPGGYSPQRRPGFGGGGGREGYRPASDRGRR